MTSSFGKKTKKQTKLGANDTTLVTSQVSVSCKEACAALSPPQVIYPILSVLVFEIFFRRVRRS